MNHFKKTALEYCERELLHLSGAIQPFGALIAIDATNCVTSVSANLSDYLGQSAESILGKSISSDFLSWKNRCNPESQFRQCRALNAVNNPEKILDIAVTRLASGQTVFELTHHQSVPTPDFHENWIITPKDRIELSEKRLSLLNKIREVTGFERVMYYAFREDGDGEVQEEVCAEGVTGSYLHLRFPGTDIPQIARKLYLLNAWRLIPDAKAKSVPIISNDAELLDLSKSDLRSASPIHCAYLMNMGVNASLSFPVIIANELVALISAHHRDAKSVPQQLMKMSADCVKDFSLSYASFRAKERFALTHNFKKQMYPWLETIQETGGLAHAWEVIAKDMLEQLEVDGMIYVRGETVFTAGNELLKHHFLALHEWQHRNAANGVEWIENLQQIIPSLSESPICGAVLIPIDTSKQPQYLYLLRHEYRYEVDWGGNPDKPIESMSQELQISPRKSFDKWTQIRSGYCRPWSSKDKMFINALRTALLSVH